MYNCHKVKKEYEGIGRYLIYYVFNSLKDNNFTIFLHTQDGSFKAIKLYTDLGFVFLTYDKIGFRKNDLYIVLPYLKETIPSSYYNKFKFEKSHKEFLFSVQNI